MQLKKVVRAILSANILLLFVFAFLPVLMFKPDIELMTTFLEYINKE